MPVFCAALMVNFAWIFVKGDTLNLPSPEIVSESKPSAKVDAGGC
jgi:hypothetical protein